ncbi:MAG: leucine-rich repeat domain-containing protein [Prevotella sp.]|nr:leucine-rich repeat domain-containing protein [Prevotella sp.]
MRKILLLLVTALFAMSANAQNQGPKHALQKGASGTFFLYHSGTPTENANGGYQALVGATLYQSGTKWNPISQSEAGNNVSYKNNEGWTTENINTAHANEGSAGDVVGIPTGTYYEYYITVVEDEFGGNGTTTGPSTTAPQGVDEEDIHLVGAEQIGNQHLNQGTYYFKVLKYTYSYFRKDRVWNEIGYNNGERKENLTYYSTSDEMPAAPSGDNQFIAVGGVYWYVENGQWVADIPDTPTSWESPVLTMGTTESKTISQVMSGYGITAANVQTVNGPGYTYDKATGTLTVTGASVDYNEIKQQLIAAGFTVNKIVLGNYVTIECDNEKGDVVVFDSHDETDVIGSNLTGNNKLSAAEKQALLNVVRLKLKNTISDSDWSGLDGHAGEGNNDQTTSLRELDLSEAKISDADAFGGGVKLSSKFKHVRTLILPTDSSYDKIPGDFAKGCEVENIDFPNNITSIGSEAFKNCDNLQMVEIDANVTSIGDGAFMSCDALTSVEFARGITHLDFGASIFEECRALKTAILPEGLENIGVKMFYNCHMLESVRLPNSLTSIPEGSFENCVSLPLIVIPEGVTWIGESAFRNSGIRDLYLTQNDPTNLPLIKPLTGNTDDSSFGQYALNANTSLVNPNEGSLMANMTSDEADDFFRSVVVGNNSIVEIHYPASGQTVTVGDKQIDTMDYFLKGNPWYHNADLLTAIQNKDKSAAQNILGVEITGEFGNDDDWVNVVQRIYDEPLFTDCYAYPDQDGRRWPSHNLKENEMRYIMGLVEKAINNGKYQVVQDGNYSNLAWRQFVYMDSYDPHEEIFSKVFDDTWYTICFPFNCTEEQLKSAFNADFNVCEFSGVALEEGEMDENGVITDKMLFLFTNIANTYYMDKAGAYFDQVRVLGQETINGINVTVEQRWYHPAKIVKDEFGHDQLQRVNPGEEGWPDWLDSNHTTTYEGEGGGWFNKQTITTNDEKIKYNEIAGILARAYHPYMLHPKHVEGPSYRRKYSTCYIPKVEYKKKFYKSNGTVDPDALEEVKAGYAANTVTCKLSTVRRSAADNDVINLKDRTVYLQPVEDGKYQYTFVGTPVPNEKNANGKVTSGEKIPNGAYFLGLKGNNIDTENMTDAEIEQAVSQLSDEQKWPKFYRRDTSKNNGGGYWMQYTAIIQPNDEAAAWENGHDEIHYQGQANGFSFALGEFEEVTADEIQEIINEAKAENKPVKHIDMVININGQVVREGTSLLGLPKGIYIVNGKKYMVR